MGVKCNMVGAPGLQLVMSLWQRGPPSLTFGKSLPRTELGLTTEEATSWAPGMSLTCRMFLKLVGKAKKGMFA